MIVISFQRGLDMENLNRIDITERAFSYPVPNETVNWQWCYTALVAHGRIGVRRSLDVN